MPRPRAATWPNHDPGLHLAGRESDQRDRRACRPAVPGTVNGWPLDFNGYVGLLYRNENGLQADGLQVDACMKAFYYGFPSSRWVNTRFGFGFGISYANHVPSTEMIRSGAGAPPSTLLNYLDPTIDTGPAYSPPRACWAASMAGSNYIYAYLESSF
ncbi:MAG TPA: hypothetical protein VJ484_05350 [Lysobacter sp.]|nr:hypothetical protein [Lysobacter sp.]